MKHIEFPVRPTVPQNTMAGQEIWKQYANDLVQAGNDLDLEITQRDDSVKAVATLFRLHFQVASLTLIGHTDTGQKILKWVIEPLQDEKLFIQAAKRVCDVFTKDNYGPYVELAWGTTNGILPQY
jgi:hypothetical protein